MLEESNPQKITAKYPDDVLDAVIVGAGFAGLYMLYRLRSLGLKTRLYDAAADVGGTWYWNRYPGCACDVESVLYSYSFSKELEQEWTWSRRYASQSEILRYAEYVADRFDLRKDIQFRTRVLSANFDESEKLWIINTDYDDRVAATFCIMATGCLSASKPLDFEGLDQFAGRTYHTAHWPHEEVDFSGQRVGVVGTGSSGIQLIPKVAEAANQLYVFQRTPNFSIPARNRPMTAEEDKSIKDNYSALRHKQRNDYIGLVGGLEDVDNNPNLALKATSAEREAEYEYRWRLGGLYFYTSYDDLMLDQRANDTVAEFVRKKIREKVEDPDVADLLTPEGYPFGAKRLCADTNYFETFNRDNVTLVDVNRAPIKRFTARGPVVNGKEYELDSVVFATGFDAMTGALDKIDIRGIGGARLKGKWTAGPYTYLGLMTAGFPNLFSITQAGSPSVLYNMIIGAEQQVDWITDCIAHLRERGNSCIDPTVEAERNWTAHLKEVADETLFVKANSWYLGANVPGKPQVILPYLGGFDLYEKKCDEVARRGYEGFDLY